MKDAFTVTEQLYTEANIFSAKNKSLRKQLPKLPTSCWESADFLLKNRRIYERDGVFPRLVIDSVVAKLKSYNDKHLRETLFGKEVEIRNLVKEYLHCQ